jgi:hypothetical protein
VTGTRLILSTLAALLVAVATDAAIFPRKKLDANRVKQLADTLRTEPDERKRRAAVAELKEADPRVLPEATLALVAALQRDPSAAVRTDAAEAIGQSKVMVPLAGVALEQAAESDPAPAVRDAAQQALWEYHLIGYRSAKGADGIAGQTAEPPVARPAVPRPVIVQVTAPDVPTPVAVMPRPVAPKTTSTSGYQPPMPPTPPAEQGGIRTLVTAAPPPQLNLTDEPPLASTPPMLAPENMNPPIPEASLPPVSLPPDAPVIRPITWTPPRVSPYTFRPSISLPRK